MFISKKAYVALIIWSSISGIFITSDEIVIANTILFIGSLICLEIRMLREESEERGKNDKRRNNRS